MSTKSLSFLLFGEDKGAGSLFGALGDHATTVTGHISHAFGAMGNAIGGEVGGLISETADKLDILGEKASKGQKLMAGGAAIAGIGTALQMLGSGEQQATDQLKQAVTDSGHSWDDYEKQIDAAVKTQENFGHSAEDTKAALQKMTQATNDPKKALAEMSIVANLAAAKHISLADAAGMVDKIMSGKGARTLAEFGITMGKGKDKTAEAQKALEELAKKIDGQASASMDNFGAKVGEMKTKIGDWAAETAGVLGPAITALGPIMMVVGTGMEIMTARKAATAAASAAVTVATEAEAVATEGATVAQTGFNVALLANPIGLVVLAIAALVGGFVLAYNKIGWFKDGVDTAMAGVKVAIGWIVDKGSEVFGWLKEHWQLILGILTGPFGLAVLAIATHWDTIKTGALTLVDGIKTVFGGIVNAITWPFRTAFNTVSDLWNATLAKVSFSVPSWIPGIGGKGWGFPTMPHLAMGGTLISGGSVMVGERGPEVLNLPAGASVLPLGRASSGGGDLNIYLTTGAVLTDGRSLAQMVDTAFTEAKLRGWRPKTVSA